MKVFYTVLLLLVGSVQSFADERGINVQAFISKPDGSPLSATGVTVDLKVLSPNNCILLEEEHLAVNITNGFLYVVLGKGSRTGNDRGLTLAQVNNNRIARSNLDVVGSAVGANDCTYTPTADKSDPRKLRISLMDGTTPIVASFNLRASAYAIASDEAESLQGKAAADFAQINGNVSQQNIEDLAQKILGPIASAGAGSAFKWNGTALVAYDPTSGASISANTIAGTSISSLPYSKLTSVPSPLSDIALLTACSNGQIIKYNGTNWVCAAESGGGGAVSSVASKTGAVTLVASDITDFSTAADARITTVVGGWKDVANGIAGLNSSGKIPVASVQGLGEGATANVGTVAGTIASGDDSRIVKAIANGGSSSSTNVVSIVAGLDIGKPAAGTAGRIYVATDAQKIYRDNGSSWDVIATAGGGGGTVTSVSGSGPISVSNGTSTPAISITQASSGSDGYLSSSDWTTFNGKQSANTELSGVAGIASLGILQRTAAGTYTGLGTAAPLNVTAGNIGIALGTGMTTSSGSLVPDGPNITNLNASYLASGTVSSARLPAASSSADGIVNQIAQSFSGVKTFVNNLIAQGTLTVTGVINANGGVAVTGNVSSTGAVSADRVKVANSSDTCNGTIEGSLRYNSVLRKMEYCNGTSWTNISSGTSAVATIGSPSSSLVKSGPVTFTVTYGSGTDTATITLATNNVTINGTATAGCSVTGVSGSGSTRTVTVNGCTGTGTVNISLESNTAQSTTGDAAASAGPSSSYNVDNTGPNAPTGLALGSVPSDLSSSPTISYTAPSDVGGSTVSYHQVRIIKTSDSSVIADWATHTSGNAVTGLSLASNTGYSVLVRAVDALGNTGTASSASSWTSFNDPCAGTPAAGTSCGDGTIYMGSYNGYNYRTTPGGCTVSATPTCAGGADSYAPSWGSNSTTTGFQSLTDGAANTTGLAALGSGWAAATYCQNMVYGGYSDWFLPAVNELNLFWSAGPSNFSGLRTDGSYYYSSSENSTYTAQHVNIQRFSDGLKTYYDKTSGYFLRCVRKY